MATLPLLYRASYMTDSEMGFPLPVADSLSLSGPHPQNSTGQTQALCAPSPEVEPSSTDPLLNV